MENPPAMTATRSVHGNAVRSVVPGAINWATFGYLIHLVFSLFVLMLFILNRGAVASAVRGMNPGMVQSRIDAKVNSIQLVVNGSHAFFGVLSACFALLIRTGKNVVRVASSIAFVLAVLETIYAWSSPTNVPAILPATQSPYIIAVQIVMLSILSACVALQWLPRASRNFFAAQTREW